MKKVFPIMFGILFCLALVWLFLCYRLFKILETRHPEKYQSMGQPTLMINNTLLTNIALIKFLFKREWRDLDDSELTTLSKAMLVLFAIYLVSILTLFLSALLVYAP